ncbi:MAG: L-2-hydroxyglutarate oxidase [Bacteroidia bacterium]|nr:L-2-hydroxyglutarate oxidase [Bacteroidia bacterium]MDW8158511.1 L-2-hydroxyglutarate oxidase [Bacteroidia bacterium]
MSLVEKLDIIILGGGLIGLSAAYYFSQNFPKLKIGILEKEKSICTHQSKNNSGVIHSGVYYKPGTLKAQNCIEGKDLLIAFAQENRIPYKVCGKIIVATQEEELEILETIYQRGIANGLDKIEKIDLQTIKKIEPYCQGVAAIWVPYTGVIDYPAVAQKLAEHIQKNSNNKIYLNQIPYKIDYQNNIYLLHTRTKKFECSYLVSCTGLQSDRVARLCGIKPKVRIVPFRGDYYHLSNGAAQKVNHLIYPVPNPNFPFLGIHFTRTISGIVECGPSAVLSFDREGYHKTAFNLYDTLDIFTYTGALKLFLKYWQIGWLEFKRAFSKKLFLQSAQKLIPSLQIKDLEKPRCGIRAVAVAFNGEIVDDFYFEYGPNAVLVLNAPSPAATACLSIGKYILHQCIKLFKL